MFRTELRSYSFIELKSVLKDLRKQQKEARLNENREEYFDILDDIQKVTFKMRNIIRQSRKLKIIKSSKEF